MIDICTLKIPLGQFPISWFACHSAETSKRLFKILQFAMTLLVHTLFCLPYLKILTLQFLPTYFFLTLFAAIEEMYRIHLRSATLLLIVNPSNCIRIFMTAFGTGLNRTVFQKENVGFTASGVQLCQAAFSPLLQVHRLWGLKLYKHILWFYFHLPHLFFLSLFCISY